MLVILDTNIVFRNFRFDGPEFQILLDACEMAEHTDIRLGMPEVIIAEIKKKYEEELESHLQKVTALHQKSLDLLGDVGSRVTTRKLPLYLQKYDAHLTSILSRPGIRILPIP